MVSFIYSKLNSQMARTLSKNMNKEVTNFFKKQVVFFSMAVFRPMSIIII